MFSFGVGDILVYGLTIEGERLVLNEKLDGPVQSYLRIFSFGVGDILLDLGGES